ncbi:MAG TPA: aldo/keto reductase [Chloroflexota bacterium]|jgi:aryl-alcohol dehydrogenase-like predicted oxidoreductase|nr:aldo/keto reductase [Chloroflexota bacterium]
MQYRTLGRTGARLSVIGYGGILCTQVEQTEADRHVASAVDRGVTYFDVAPSYGNGEAEEKLGPALDPYRRGVFLACKTGKRDAAGARAELEQSLRRLRTDHFDLYQLHAMTTPQDVEQVFAPGGAMEVLRAAREQGQTRFLGFSAHSVEAAVALLERFPFDSVLAPFNFSTFYKGNFGPQIVEAAQRAGAGLLALKGMARTKWPEGLPREQRTWPKCWYEPIADQGLASLALRFTLGLPVTAAIPPGHHELWEMALEVASEPTPLTPAEEVRLRAAAEETDPIFRAAA